MPNTSTRAPGAGVFGLWYQSVTQFIFDIPLFFSEGELYQITRRVSAWWHHVQRLPAFVRITTDGCTVYLMKNDIPVRRVSRCGVILMNSKELASNMEHEVYCFCDAGGLVDQAISEWKRR